MATLRRLGLVEVLRETAGVGRPLMGVCLGVQLLMQESEEFGRSEGLGIFEGNVVRFDRPRKGARELKVPEVGWNRIHRRSGTPADVWKGGPLDGISDGEHLYFVHSYFVRPADPSVVLSLTRYGDVEYCSSIARGSVFACQFHPERSGEEGLKIYRNWAAAVQRHKEGAPFP